MNSLYIINNYIHKFLLRLLILFTGAWFIFIYAVQSQDRFTELEKQLAELSKTIPGLNETVSFSVNGASIQEFLRGVANNTNLNINIDPAINITIVNNFAEVRVMDILFFLCKEYNLKITNIGTILTVSKYEKQQEKTAYTPKELMINYSLDDELLSLELLNDTLHVVAKTITQKTGKNIVLAPGIGNQLVNGFIQNMPFDNVMEKFAFSNNLTIQKTDDNFYLVDKATATTDIPSVQQRRDQKTGKTDKTQQNENISLSLNILHGDILTIAAAKTPIIDIIHSASEKLQKNYYLMSEIQGEATIKVDSISYDNLLSYLFDGTKYSYRKQNDIYLLGDSKIQQLLAFKVVPLQYRTVEKVIDLIPADIKKEAEIKEFADQNSLLITGTESKIRDIENFIREIDKVVPVILIEVLIVDVSKKYTKSLGVKAGLSTTPVTTQGSIFPALDMQLSSGTINDLINSFNGFGWITLGKVTPEFYINLKALEDNGIIKMRSTPKLSTLNGHEATLSIGKTEYYLEEQNNVVGTQNPQNITTRRYQSVNADLSVTIKPFVSGDEQVTLDVKVTQSDFTARISPNAPPGKVTRDFQSLIRVKNQEMVLLGGLEDRTVAESGTGVPILSHIPVIKWLFSYRTHENKKSKLNIFIKPTVIY